MMVTADDVSRSLRGAADLLNRRAEGLAAFDVTEAGFWRSFGAIWLTLPSFVVLLALERRHVGLGPETPLWFDPAAAASLALAYLATFLALPIAMIAVCRRLGLGAAYAPFVVVTNWLSAITALVLAGPGLLVALGWAPPALGAALVLAFGLILLHLQWFAVKATLGLPGLLALAVAGCGVALQANLWMAVGVA